MLKIQEIKARSILSKSKLPGIDFVINPYRGCQHACVYCYACFMQKFDEHTESWGEYVDIKINAPELLAPVLVKCRNRTVTLSSVCDPYQPVEVDYQLTRRLLSQLISVQPKLSVQTKSALIVRDIDLLTQFKDCSAGLTIVTMDENLRGEIEPGASTIAARVEALRQLKTAGLKTYIFVGPILPYLTGWKQIVRQTREFADYYLFDHTNPSGCIWSHIRDWLIVRRPALLKSYERVLFDSTDYWAQVSSAIKNFSEKEKINYRIFF
ncbi:MAG: radical SAM protein [Candidatus Neomarinimicrobiota bacterium]